MKRHALRRTASTPLMAMLPLQLLLLLLPRAPGAAAVSTSACESEMLNLYCPAPGTALLVRSAMYGRHAGSYFKCGDNLNLTMPCEVDVTDFVKYRCQGQPQCHILVDLATFDAEFCPDVFKYAEVEYDCVQAHSLDALRRCSQKCLPPSASGASLYSVGVKQSSPSLLAATPIAAAAAASMKLLQASTGSASPEGAVSHPVSAKSSVSTGSAAEGAKSPSQGPTPIALPYSNLNQNFFSALTNAGKISHPSGSSGNGNNQGNNNTAMLNQLRQVLMSRMQSMMASLQNKRTIG